MASPPRSRTPACIIHCRVSTAKQAYEGESLDVQTNICANIAASKGWRIAHEPWKEGFSGRKEVRPVFQEILGFIDANPGTVRYYLFRSIDRATRGGSFSYEGMKRALLSRGVEMVDSYGIIQPARNTLEDLGFEYPWSVSSPSEIAEVVVATSAKADLTNILTRLIGQEIRLRQQGYKIRGAVDGFVNERVFVDGRKRVIERPDPERAKYYVAMFDLRASGQLTDQEISERVNALGFRTKIVKRWDRDHRRVIGSIGGTPLSIKRLQEIIKRPIYCGIICEKWTGWKPIKAAYEGLVSVETFNAANRGKIVISTRPNGELAIAHNVARKLNRANPLFPFRRVIVCPTCRKPFVGSSPKGRSGQGFPTYHCSRRHKYIGISKPDFEQAIAGFLSSLQFKPEGMIAIRYSLVDLFRRQQSLAEADYIQSRRVAAELEQAKRNTIKAFAATNNEVIRRGLEAEVERIENEIRQTDGVGPGLKISQEDIDDFLLETAKVMERPAVLLETSITTPQFEALWEFVFEGKPSFTEIADGTANLAWIFRIAWNANGQSGLVHLDGLRWNQIESSIMKWKSLSKPLEAIWSRQRP